MQTFIITGPVDKYGNECYVHCPAFCGPDEIQCWGGIDSSGCPMKDTCIPNNQGDEVYFFIVRKGFLNTC